MADLSSLEITIHLRWWLKPYVKALGTVAGLMAPLVGERRASEFIDRQCDWLAQSGVKYEDGGRHG